MTFYPRPTRRTEITFDHYRGNNKHQRTTWGLWYWWTAIARKGGLLQGQSRRLSLHVDPEGRYRARVSLRGRRRPPQSRPCQQVQGDKRVRAIEDSYLIRTVFKKNTDLKFDRRAFQKRGLYGRTWAKGCPP